MTSLDLEPVWLTLKLAAVTTSLLLIICLPFAWWLVQAPPRLRLPIQALVSMPLVLPPSVLGFYLLLAFSPAHFPGRLLKETFDFSLAFSFTGLVVGSLLFSLPFMMNPLIGGLEALPKSLYEAAYVLGKSRWETFLRVLIPNLKPALLTGIVLSFAHTMGEFGVVLMIGGKIPGQTKVASIAIYDEVEALRFANANAYAVFLFMLSFAILVTLIAFNRKLIKPF